MLKYLIPIFMLLPVAWAHRMEPTTELRVPTARLAALKPLGEITERHRLGIEFEDETIRESTMAWAREYVKIRQMGTKARAEFIKNCDHLNPFCRFENSRTSVAPPRKKSIRVPPKVIEALRIGNFDMASSLNSGEAFVAVKNLSSRAVDLAKRALIVEECQNPEVLFAIGNKLEETFPRANSMQLASAVYKKGMNCGEEGGSGASAFRLGLLRIWNGDCSQVDEIMAKVESIKAVSHFHSRSKFWRHHCAGMMGRTSDLVRLKEDIIRKHPLSFHALIVNNDEPHLWKFIEQTQTPRIAMRSIAAPNVNARLRAIESLIILKNANLASELAATVGDQLEQLEPEVRLYLALVMDQADQTLQNFRILNDIFLNASHLVSRSTMKLFFPLKFWQHIESKNRMVDPMLLLSLIRQESAFNLNAKSAAGARGLMQVMPTTARYIASVRGDKLYDPATNITVGTSYFVKRLAQFQGDVELTLAAYNAGYSRVLEWQKRYPTDNRLLFLDLIPFRETREYVTSILRNYYWYMHLYKNEFDSQSIYRNLWNKQMPTNPLSLFTQHFVEF